MSTSRTMNMTEGNTLRLLTVFSIPMLIGNLFQQAYNLADSMIVGKFLGADALAAVGATGAVTFLFFSVCNGISSGGGIITSRYFGAGDDANVKKSIANSAYIMFSIGILTGLIAYLLTPTVLNFMGTPKSILPDSITYMRMSCIGVPFIGIYNYASSMLRALGDSRTPLYFLIISCFLNVCMDLFLSNISIMLSRKNNCLKTCRLSFFIVLNSNLALTVRSEEIGISVLSYIGKFLGKLVSKTYRKRHKFLRIIIGITEHHTLITGTQIK